MSLDTQVALARPSLRGESTHLSRAARQVVPPFLQKLYEIVNDASNEELIKWSENGDSFYVLNHEKFAREVLGRWFKHQKFASFVRQLNMYGFHKIPHLQQGVLKSDSDTEPWHFEHPNFHRGQPDLLCLIQRKKQPAHGQPDDAAMDMHDAASPVASVTPGHLMDINSIVNGVAAIKRHQQAISADLSALKQSNDALWKEAVAARQRHAKHQDTINRILKFLAGVFGHTDDAGHSSDGSHSPPQVTPLMRQRLMIGDGRAPSKVRHVDIMEVEDDEANAMRGTNSFSSDRYATIETPDVTVSSPSIAHSDAFSSAAETSSDRSKTPPVPVRPSHILSRTNSRASTPRLTNGSTDSTPAQTPPAFGAQTNGQHVDAVWQAALQHMMTSPGQLQKFVQAFASQQPVTGLGNQDSVIPQSASVIQAYDPNQQDYLRWFSAPGTPVASAPASLSPPLLAPIHPEDSASLQILLDEQQRLQKNYEDAAEIDADMDMLQSSINSLIHNLGIDPASLAPSPPDEPMSPTSPTAPSHPGAVLNGHGSGTNGFAAPMAHDSFTNGLNGMHSVSDGMGATQPENLLDSLLSQIGDGHSVGNGHGVGFDAIGGHMMDGYQDITNHYDHNTRIDGTSIEDASTEQLTAFLDEAAGAEAAPGVAASRSPKVGPIGGAAAHQKRKSDVIDLQLPISSEGGTGKKAKRKR